MGQLLGKVNLLLQRPVAVNEPALLAIIFEAVVGRSFGARELYAHALAVGGPLLETLVAAKITNPKRLGKRLKTMSKRGPLGGLILARIGDDREGAIWSVARVE